MSINERVCGACVMSQSFENSGNSTRSVRREAVATMRDPGKLTAVPTLRYRNVGEAAKWAATVLGLQGKTVTSNSDDAAVYAEMRFGNSIVIFSGIGVFEFDQLLKQPDEVGGVVTQACYFVIDEVEDHFHHAKSHGADIVLDLTTYHDGGKGYACRDPEGHLWCFGSYDPWAGLADGGAPLLHGRSKERAQNVRNPAAQRPIRMAALQAAAGILLFAAGLGTGFAFLPKMLPGLVGPGLAGHETSRNLARAQIDSLGVSAGTGGPAHQRTAFYAPAAETRESDADDLETRLKAAEAAAAEARQALVAERAGKDGIEKRARDFETRLKAAEAAAAEASQALVSERAGKDGIEKTARDFETRLKAAEAAAAEASQALVSERVAKDGIEKTARDFETRLKAAEAAAAEASQALASERAGRDGIEKAARDFETRLKAAEAAAAETSQALASERVAKDGIEKTARDFEGRLRKSEAAAASEAEKLGQELSLERAQREVAETAAAKLSDLQDTASSASSEADRLRQELAQERSLRETADKKVGELESRVSIQTVAPSELEQLRDEVARERTRSKSAEEAAANRASAEQKAAADAEQLRGELARERSRRAEAEKSVANQRRTAKAASSNERAKQDMARERRMSNRKRPPAASSAKKPAVPKDKSGDEDGSFVYIVESAEKP